MKFPVHVATNRLTARGKVADSRSSDWFDVTMTGKTSRVRINPPPAMCGKIILGRIPHPGRLRKYNCQSAYYSHGNGS
jgi:hypothetical protein